MSQAVADTLVHEGDALFRAERFAEAAARFQRAVTVYPHHPLGWRGLGQALLRMGKPHEAARAFDQAIGLRPDSATALWGGALAHAEIGNQVIAKDCLRRTIALQPSWANLALGVPQLARLLQVSARAADRLRAVLGPFGTQRYHHTNHPERSVEVGRVVNVPRAGRTTFVSIGLSNTEWPDPERPRVELVLASSIANDACAQIVANLALHFADARNFPEPGVLVRDAVAAVRAGDLSRRLPHVYVCSPRPWGLELPLDEGPPAITLAQVFPISEREYQTWRGTGAARFEQRFLDGTVDVTDFQRVG
jgi:tetratricopeptide (TPR) repeat protein